MLAGASAVAMGLLAPSGAEAFDKIHWHWNNHVNGFVSKYINIHANFDPKGLVMVEGLQTQLGDVTSKSVVFNVDNNSPNGESVTQEVDLGKVNLEAAGYGKVTWNNEGELVAENGDVLQNQNCSVTGLGGCYLDLGTATITLEGMGGPLNAVTELPEVVSTAAAIGNSFSIESPTMTEFHVEQTLKGDQLFQPASIDADSFVWDIKNATVDSSATAVGNSFSLDLETVKESGGFGFPYGGFGGGSDDLIVIGDVTQFSHANMNATSFVADVSISNYNKLGKIDRPIVSSVATAVGNAANVSVNVGGAGGL
ncbi:hypothetical protein [Aquibaculum arenosum]|uniref:Uncharacterized protein n=1 Tax=Aquibaculum arenosum TaxID=3032591 RepID=A0ABT5YLX2_9PROT|nr:hypothetical protein [Fodinicurvata sp. CAU 1616]MDF2095831.1 hypothetical protein [Fodinicurvata sp. CAU 1616]